MSSPSFLQSLYIFLLFIPLVTLHEVAHAWAAHWLGDDEAEDEGRLTLNPLSHIDIWGTLILPVLNFVLNHSLTPLGWGRPVPFTPDERQPRLQMVLFAVAGPLASLLIAVILTACRTLFLAPDSTWCNLLDTAAFISGFIGLSHLLIPIPPFDGWLLLGAFFRLPEELMNPGNVWWFVAFFVLLSFTPLLSAIGALTYYVLAHTEHLILFLK
ncbi:site-2 protease family protein [Verrucomicrobium sp. GAS474]|uniref:site-2 protease family protein n=1 Tax=Verrucomicrobium sp. GAS474 TaxID=1882831 RepID=UPI000B85CA10|nr:site-2 protease family protein [Verrucomicrobium sp. GAS474]